MLALSSRAGDLARRIGPDASYLTDVLPAVTVFALGLSAAVAPDDGHRHRLGPRRPLRVPASGTNNAIARPGQVVAVAAVPSLVDSRAMRFRTRLS